MQEVSTTLKILVAELFREFVRFAVEQAASEWLQGYKVSAIAICVMKYDVDCDSCVQVWQIRTTLSNSVRDFRVFERIRVLRINPKTFSNPRTSMYE